MANAVRRLSLASVLPQPLWLCSSWAPLMLMWKRFTCCQCGMVCAVWSVCECCVWYVASVVCVCVCVLPPWLTYNECRRMTKCRRTFNASSVSHLQRLPHSLSPDLSLSFSLVFYDCQQLAWSSWSLLLSLTARSLPFLFLSLTISVLLASMPGMSYVLAN